MIILRDYQHDMERHIRQAYRDGYRAPGSGIIGVSV